MRFLQVTFILIAAATIASCNSTDKHAAAKPDVLASHVDSSVKPGDDFFSFANNNWFKQNPIPNDEHGWGLFEIIPDETLQRLRDINLEAVKANAALGMPQQKIGDFWKAANDTVFIEKNGVAPLEPYLQKIDAVTDAQGLQSLMAELARMGIDGPIAVFVEQDAKNSAVEALQMWQTGLGLPERAFYFKADSTSNAIRNAYVHKNAAYLQLLGKDSAGACTAAENILLLETKLAESSKKLEDLRDPESNYHKYAFNNLNKVLPDIDWKNYMSVLGAANTDSVIIGQPLYYKTAGSLIKTQPLETWKNYLKVRLADNYEEALPDTFDRIAFTFSQQLSGTPERKPRWKRTLRTEQGVMGELLGEVYVQKYFDDSAKARYATLVENVRTALKNRIAKLTWMSDSTKQKAYTKLAAINKKVGYPDKWKDFSALKISPDNYFQNLVNAGIFWTKYNLSKLGKPVDSTEWNMYPQTYNAYYDPSNNEIVLPAAAFIVPGYLDAELDDAVVYGYMAASTIGHELTHGFDDEGRQFDADGNLKNWWTPEDSAKFMQKAGRLADQYSKYVVIDTFKINGKATLGENIADLGGVQLGYDAFKLTDQYKKGEKIGGYTPTQRFFLGYALSWMEDTRPKALRTQALVDVHSPAKYRVNGPLTNVDEFYNAFNIQPGDKMYTPDSLRVRIL